MSNPTRPRRALLGVACIAAVVVTLAACGDDDDAVGSTVAATEPQPATTTATATTDAATTDGPTTATASYPVTVTHKYGTTTIPAEPQRIVSLDTQWTDVLLALHAPLVGRALDTTVPDGTFPWQQGLVDDVAGIESGDSIPFEKIAALQPDLIVVTYLVQDEATYAQLAAIAPTIPLLSPADQVDQWQEIATVAGSFLGDPAAAAALIADVDSKVQATAAELPALRGRTYALANWVPGDSIYVVADPEDGASVFFAQLGLAITPSVLAVADGVSGRATLSLERVDLLDGDLLVLFTNGADPADIPGYAALPAVQTGAVAVLDYAAVVGLNTPTPLSVPYSLELVRPALEAAAAA